MNAAELSQELTEKIDAANDLGALDNVRVEALGKKGRITELMKGLGKMSPDERKEAAITLNEMKDSVVTKIEYRKDVLKKAEMEQRLATETLDMTLEPRVKRQGTIHPLTQTMDEMIAIFADMGFSIHDGPDIEDDFHNFTALNFPPKHPARVFTKCTRTRRRRGETVAPHTHVNMSNPCDDGIGCAVAQNCYGTRIPCRGHGRNAQRNVSPNRRNCYR